MRSLRARGWCALALLASSLLGPMMVHAAPPARASASRPAAVWQLSGPDHVSAREVRVVELELLAPGSSADKAFVLLPRTGHDPNPAMAAAQLEILRTRVTPLIGKGG